MRSCLLSRYQYPLIYKPIRTVWQKKLLKSGKNSKFRKGGPVVIIQSRSEKYTASRKAEYQKYLKSEHWKKTRNIILKKYGYKCRFCSSMFNLNVHHLRYYDSKGKSVLYREKPKDLMVLCEYCHKREHNLI